MNFRSRFGYSRNLIYLSSPTFLFRSPSSNHCLDAQKCLIILIQAIIQKQLLTVIQSFKKTIIKKICSFRREGVTYCLLKNTFTWVMIKKTHTHQITCTHTGSCLLGRFPMKLVTYFHRLQSNPYKWQTSWIYELMKIRCVNQCLVFMFEKQVQGQPFLII